MCIESSTSAPGVAGPGDRQRAGAPGASTEWPTLAVALAIYSLFGLLTWFHEALPAVLLVPAAAFVIAWHGSLQHEALHGHPSASARLNEWLVMPSLWLWLPYRIYRREHRRHHEVAVLTDPLQDPESYYVHADEWAAAGRVRRLLMHAHATLLGRLVLGPPLMVAHLLACEWRRLRRGDPEQVADWGWHALGCALTLVWTAGVCGIPIAGYLLLWVYPALSLSLLRSFAEHRADARPEARTAVVECGPLMSLLYLNNNLHAVHHALPGAAWYQLPALRRALGDAICAGERYSGYPAQARCYLLRAREPVVHPGLDGLR